MHNSLQINKTLFQTAEDGLASLPARQKMFMPSPYQGSLIWQSSGLLLHSPV